MIVVATADFELYYDLVGELRDRAVPVTTVEPGADLPAQARVVLVGADDPLADVEEVAVGPPSGAGEADTARVVVAEPGRARRAIEEALAVVRGGGGRTVVGVDPGARPGIAVLSGDTVVAAFQVPAAQAPETIRAELEGAVDPVVRVGDGARIEGAKVIEELDDVRVELVDETGTTPSLGTGARGMGDVLAAVNIARIEGDQVEGRPVEPTQGEIQVIKNRSRERSDQNRTIPADLARQVATGDLTLEEALDEHREE